MQNLQVAGARGWPWQVEAIETFGRSGAPAFVHLSRRSAAGGQVLVAVRPHEPLAPLAPHQSLQPVPPAAALAIVADAKRSERVAFRLPAAERLRGDIHPWQLAPALAFERGYPRVLAADDAGMGKTVSAAIAIAQCLDGASDRRCLVLAPGHLLRQWRGELRRRMGIEAPIIDAAALTRLRRDVPAGVQVWSLPGCLIASIDFLKQPHVLRSLEPMIWDLLIIDEAHLSSGVSERRHACDLIARRSRRVLLLTATPSDGGAERLDALVTIGASASDPGLVRLRHTAGGRARVERRLWIAPDPATRALHQALAEYTQWIACGPRTEAPAVGLLCSLLTKRALSSAHALRISLARRLALIGRDPQPLQPSLFEPDDDPGVLGAATGLPIGRETTRLAALAALAARASRNDRRLRALVRMVARAGEPVVVFTCFRDTAVLLARHLSPHLRVRLVHGALPQAAIEGALGDFTAGTAQVLVATDVAAQGLNLHQRCRWVAHYDLPWRPPALRQRFGRVDRLGQTRRAHATFLLDRTPLADGLLARMTALTARMQADALRANRRWDVIAAAEAARLRALRAPCATGCVDPAVRGEVSVVEIELADAGGRTVERAVTAMTGGEQAAARWMSDRSSRRCVQLRRPLLARANRRTRREQAVVMAALETVTPPLRQHGLFDRRADRARQQDTDRARDLARASREAMDRHALEGRVATVRARRIASFDFGGI